MHRHYCDFNIRDGDNSDERFELKKPSTGDKIILGTAVILSIMIGFLPRLRQCIDSGENQKKKPKSEVASQNTTDDSVRKLKDAASELGLEIPHTGWCVIIKKRDRLLYLLQDGDIFTHDTIKERFPYNVSLGTNKLGDKRKLNDLKTPEGLFFFTHVNKKSQYYLSFGISYPEEDDAELALQEGRITKEQYTTIIEALEQGKMPPSATILGGDVFLHGTGPYYLGIGDWTLGCPAISDSQMDELYKWIGRAIEAGQRVPIIILP